MQQKLMKMEKTKNDMEEFRKNKEIWKKQQQIEFEAENQRIIEYCKIRDQKKTQAEIARKQAALERDKKTQKMVSKLSEEMVKDQELLTNSRYINLFFPGRGQQTRTTASGTLWNWEGRMRSWTL